MGVKSMLKADKEKIYPVHIAMLLIFFIVFIWSVINPFVYYSWFLESLPAVLMVLVLAVTYKKFTFTTFVYSMVLAHTVILLIGAHYTYAQMPLFNWLRDNYHLSRNYYDRVGHFAQGFMPAFIIKEYLLRAGYLKKGKILSFVVICICMAISAFHELLEFGASLVSGIPGDVVLSTQGDYWDTQWDMFCAFIGVLISVFILGPLHDSFIYKYLNGK